MKLSEHFTLREFVRSQTADRRGIRNQPDAGAIAAMQLLCAQLLEPVRAQFGPVHISSGFRCLALNRAVGSGDGSQHVRGQAADFEVPGVSNYIVARWIERNLRFDQLILEMWRRGDPNAGWIHASYREPCRMQPLTYDGHRYRPGLIAA